MIWFRSFCGLERQRGSAGERYIGRLLQASAGGEQDFAKAPEQVVLGDVEGLRQTDEHAFVLFSRIGGGEGQGHIGGVDDTCAAVDDGCYAADLGLVLVFFGFARTRTTSPRLTLLLLPLKTKIPSEVARSSSPLRSCR